MKNRKKGLFIIVVVIVLFVFCSSIYLYANKIKNQRYITQESFKPVLIVDTEDTSARLTFKEGIFDDKKIGFKFNLPATYILSEIDDRIWGYIANISSADLKTIYHEGRAEEDLSVLEWKSGVKIYISVEDESEAKNIQDYSVFRKSKGYGGPLWDNERIISVDNEEALVYDFAQFSPKDSNESDIKNGYHGHILVVPYNNSIIKVTVTYLGDDGEDVFKNIVSSFEFTE